MMPEGQSPAGPERPEPGEFLRQMLTEFEVVDNTGRSSHLPIQTNAPLHFRLPAQNNDRGIELQIRQADGQLVYEGKIPVSEIVPEEGSAPITKAIVGLGLETGELDISQWQRSADGFSIGRRGGIPGRFPGGPGGLPGGADRRSRAAFQQEPLKFWGRVELTFSQK